ncbi:MAG: hypothetical protein ACRDPI_06670, partial [Nocardioidaceae bacterium]
MFVALAVVVGLTFGGASAEAKPPPGHGKIGPVTGLTATATKPAAAYVVKTAWNALTGATKYTVTMTNASGTKLGSATVTTPTWSASTTSPVNTKVTVTVVPFAGNRRGKAKSVSTVLPDLTAPVGSYSISQPGNGSTLVTLTQVTLSDNASPAANLTQTVNWGDGTTDATAAGTTTSFQHTYPNTSEQLYPVTVTVTDQAGNSSEYDFAAAILDVVAPTGSYTVTPGAGYAKWTKVTVRATTAPTDDLSSVPNITQTVDWNDGTPAQTFADGATLSHVYQTGGTFNPTVVLTDQAGNSTVALVTAPVVVTVDTKAPVVRLVLPKAHRTHESSWRLLHGRATDAGTGVRNVQVRAIERRGSAWYSYRPATHKWVKAGTRAAAWKKSRVMTVRTTATHKWTVRV